MTVFPRPTRSGRTAFPARAVVISPAARGAFECPDTVATLTARPPRPGGRQTVMKARAQAPLPVPWREAVLPNLSNSPSRAPQRKASHSPCVNLRTGPSGSLLLRTPTEPPGSSVTSRQLPLEKLRELFVQIAFICSVLVTRMPLA